MLKSYKESCHKAAIKIILKALRSFSFIESRQQQLEDVFEIPDPITEVFLVSMFTVIFQHLLV